jgi:hypothetical protein
MKFYSMNYPEPTRETGVEYQGYASQPYPPQPAPQMYPPQQQAPYPQPIQGYPPQQMQGYMPPINVVVNTTNTNVNENTAMPSFVYVRGVPFLVRVLYFLFIGYWLGTCWAVVALIFTALGAFGVIGAEIGEKMVRLIPKMFFL